MTVLDASVLAKLFIEEDGSELAEAIISNTHPILAPDIARIEVASAITRACRNKTMDEENGRRQLNAWRRCIEVGTVQLVETTKCQIEAESLSLRLRHPLADCLYLAVAIDRKMPLVTADQPFIDVVASHYEAIRHFRTFMS
jgi:predicted nucleic acid-binding protein